MHRNVMNTSTITQEQVQAQLSEAVATKETRSDDEQQKLLSELLAVALTTSRIGSRPAYPLSLRPSAAARTSL